MNTLKRLILSKAGELSLTKLGAWLVAAAGAALAAGILSPDLIPWAKFVIAFGTATAVAGARDTVGPK
jgi:hypothetical protein